MFFVGDGKTLILEYKEGNSACSHTKRRSDNTAAKVIIKFECGNTVGGPVYVSGLVLDFILCYSTPHLIGPLLPKTTSLARPLSLKTTSLLRPLTLKAIPPFMQDFRL